MEQGLIIKKNTMLYLCLLLLLILAPFFTILVPQLSYVDELVTVLCVLIIAFKSVGGILNRSAGKILYALVAIELIGIASTVFSGISESVYASVMDAFLFVKPYVLFLAFYTLSQTIKKDILRRLLPLSKFMLIFICAFKIIILFTSIDLDPGKKYVLSNDAQMLWLAASCLIVIAYSVQGTKKLKFYLILYIVSILIGIGGLGGVLIAATIVFLYVYRSDKTRKVKIWQWGVLGIVAFVLAYEDINEYLFNSSAPRALLIQYGFVTANNYFPLGAGFASYGSEMAARYYSNLYYQYGFNNVWSLSYQNAIGSNVSTLKDCYLGMIVGQFGWIGLICYGIIMYSIFISLLKNNCKGYVKAITLAGFVTALASMIVAANTTTSMGIVLFSTLGLVAGMKNENNGV